MVVLFQMQFKIVAVFCSIFAALASVWICTIVGFYVAVKHRVVHTSYLHLVQLNALIL